MSIDRQQIRLYQPAQAKAEIDRLWLLIKACLIAGHRLALEVRAETRSTGQNRMLWSRLHDLSKQVDWPVDGRMVKLDAEEWKDVLTAGLNKSQRIAQGIEGGFVLLGKRTSKMTVREMTDLLDLALAFGDERAVRWSRTSLGRDWPEEMDA